MRCFFARFVISIFLVGIFSLGIIPLISNARIGVGIGTGKIQVSKKLNPGGIYTIPTVTVLNTGDVESDYKMDIQYNEIQDQLKPSAEWFHFSPLSFHLKPGQAQPIHINLILPVKAHPGDYFAYVEARPTMAKKQGVMTIGIAAATKLYFTVAPANFIQGIIYRTTSFWNKYSPWTWIVLVIIILISFGKWFKERFHFQIAVTKK